MYQRKKTMPRSPNKNNSAITELKKKLFITEKGKQYCTRNIPNHVPCGDEKKLRSLYLTLPLCIYPHGPQLTVA